MIARYRVTLEVETYDLAVELLRLYIRATGGPPRGVLIQGLDDKGEPLWAPPARERPELPS